MTPSFYYVFNISLSRNINIPSFIGNLWWVLLLGNHLKPVQEGNVQELEKFADTLVSTVVTLWEHGRLSELEPGSLLFTVVLEKIPKSVVQILSLG